MRSSEEAREKGLREPEPGTEEEAREVEPILTKVHELEELLYDLNRDINSLVSRNLPSPESGEMKLAQRQRDPNIFDKIIYTLSECIKLTQKIREKIELDISQKVL